MAKAQQTTINMGLINRGPTRTAARAPNWAPRKAAKAMAIATGQIITPLVIKTDRAPRLQEALASLVKLMARIMPRPQRSTNPTIKKDPTPGPKIPS
ncbi:hypothetical protein D3C87_1515640 [compost metagenome]